MIWPPRQSAGEFPSAVLTGLQPVPARRAVDSAIVCGVCSHPIAERSGVVLEFPQDSERGGRWKGWHLSQLRRRGVPGGVWRVSGRDEAVQPSLFSRIELLPAIIECPYCTVPNLFDANRLNVREDQLVARSERLPRHSGLSARMAWTL